MIAMYASRVACGSEDVTHNKLACRKFFYSEHRKVHLRFSSLHNPLFEFNFWKCALFEG